MSEDEGEDLPVVEVDKHTWSDWLAIKQELDKYKGLYAEKSEHIKKQTQDYGPGPVRMTVDGEHVGTVHHGTQERFDSGKFKDQYPDIYRQFLKESPTSRITRKNGGES